MTLIIPNERFARFVVHTVLSVARYVCVLDDLRIGLGSIPIRPRSVEPLCPRLLGKPAVALMHEPMSIFVSADRLLPPPPTWWCS